MITLPNVNGEMIIGKGEFAYKKVIEDFSNTSFIGILTYNISQKQDSILLQSLEKACQSNVETILITNIPKRFKKYYGDSYALAAKKTIDVYLKLLNPTLFGANMSTWFLFENHAKIIVTDNMAFWGSSNFSDESADNLECGTITTDKNVIDYLKNDLFPLLKEKSVPFYRHDFAKAIFLIEEAMELCNATKEAFFQASFIPWEDYDTNFNTVWLFDTHHSGVTRKLLKNFVYNFQQYEQALSVVNEIVDKYSELDELPDDVEQLRELSDRYSDKFEETQSYIDELFDCIDELSNYNVDDKSSRIINDSYGMEAFDENLDYYAELAFQEANDTYEELIKEAQPAIQEIIEALSDMVDYFNAMKNSLHSLLAINPQINNTGK